VRNLIEEAGKSQDCPIPRLLGRPSAIAKNILQLKSLHNKYWPVKYINPTAGLYVFFSQAKKGYSV